VPVQLSAASVLEAEIKAAIGKLVIPADLVEALEADRFVELPIRAAHAREAARLEPLHRDPFDRMLVAQARLEGQKIADTARRCSRDPLAAVRLASGAAAQRVVGEAAFDHVLVVALRARARPGREAVVDAAPAAALDVRDEHADREVSGRCSHLGRLDEALEGSARLRSRVLARAARRVIHGEVDVAPEHLADLALDAGDALRDDARDGQRHRELGDPVDRPGVRRDGAVARDGCPPDRLRGVPSSRRG
jgi:PIN domain nuclease of toxin-antitoxin system